MQDQAPKHLVGGGRTRTKMITAFAVIIFALLTDRFLKRLALAGADGPELWGGIFRFHFVENRYIAFSLPFTGPILAAAVAILLAVVSVYGIRAYRHGRPDAVWYAAIFAGGASNLYDRLLYGYVIDYLDLRYFTVFNLADVMITVGALVLVVLSLERDRKKRSD